MQIQTIDIFVFINKSLSGLKCRNEMIEKTDKEIEKIIEFLKINGLILLDNYRYSGKNLEKLKPTIDFLNELIYVRKILDDTYAINIDKETKEWYGRLVEMINNILKNIE